MAVSEGGLACANIVAAKAAEIRNEVKIFILLCVFGKGNDSFDECLFI